MGPTRPLAGRRVVVTRSPEQAGALRDLLAARGAEVVEVPVLVIAEPADGGAALAAVAGQLAAGGYAWLVVTSANGVDRVRAALAGRDVAPGTRVAAVGRATAAALARAGLPADLVPERFVGEELVAAFPPPGPAGRVLLAQAAGARPVVAAGLAAKGWAVETVEAYRTTGAPVDATAAAAVARADAVTFTSASTVTHLVAAVGAAGLPPVVASIGPVTTAAAEALGVAVTVEAAESTVAGLVDALERLWA